MARGQQSKIRFSLRPTGSLVTTCGKIITGANKAVKLRFKHHVKHCTECGSSTETETEYRFMRNMSNETEPYSEIMRTSYGFMRNYP